MMKGFIKDFPDFFREDVAFRVSVIGVLLGLPSVIMMIARFVTFLAKS